LSEIVIVEDAIEDVEAMLEVSDIFEGLPGPLRPGGRGGGGAVGRVGLVVAMLAGRAEDFETEDLGGNKGFLTPSLSSLDLLLARRRSFGFTGKSLGLDGRSLGLAGRSLGLSGREGAAEPLLRTVTTAV